MSTPTIARSTHAPTTAIMHALENLVGSDAVSSTIDGAELNDCI